MKYQGYIFKFKVKDRFLDPYLNKLKSSAMSTKKDTPSIETQDFLLHQKIMEKCSDLLKSKSYAEAVEKSFKIVKDRLREITGYESGADAFGKGRIRIKGAAAANVDDDFNKAVQYLMMSIDMFRNEKSHTSDAKIDDPIRAYRYLVLSSLALSLLENYELKAKD